MYRNRWIYPWNEINSCVCWGMYECEGVCVEACVRGGRGGRREDCCATREGRSVAARGTLESTGPGR